MAEVEATIRLRDQVTSTVNKVNGSLQSMANRMQSVKNRISKTFDNNKSFDFINKQIDNLSNKEIKIQANVDSMVQAQEKLQNVNKVIEQLNARKARLQVTADKLDPTKQKIQVIEEKMNTLSNKKVNLEANADKVKNAADKIDKIDEQMSKLGSKKISLEADVSKAERAKQSIAEIDEKLNGLRSKKVDLEMQTSKLDKAQEMLSAVQKKIASLEKQKLDIDTSGISSSMSKALNAVKNFGNGAKNVLSNVKNSFGQFKNDLQEGFSSIGQGNQKSQSVFKSMLAATGVTKAVGFVSNMVKGSIGGAISRIDTMNNADRTFANMGFSVQETDTAMTALNESITGLPTAMNDAVENVQLLASSTHDLGKSEKIFSGINNAVLGFGGTSENVSGAVMQLSQAFSKGKIDGQAMNSLLSNNMGPVLDAMANKMGKTSAEFRDGLSKGTISVEQFQDALIDLNENGGGGLAALKQIASDATKGLATSMANMRTAVVRGTAEVIKNVDKFSEKVTGKSLTDWMAVFGSKMENGLKSFAAKMEPLADKIKPYFDVLKNGFTQMSGPVGKAIDAIKDSLSKLTGSFGNEKSVQGFQGFIDGITNGITKIAEFAEKHSDTIAKLISQLPKLFGAMLGFKIVKGIASPIANYAKGLGVIGKATGNLFKNLFGGGLGGKGKKIPEFELPKVPNAGQTENFKSFLSSFKGIAKAAAGVGIAFGVVKVIEELAQAMKDINDKVPSDLGSMVPKLASMGIALTGMGAFVAVAGKLSSKNPTAAIGGILAIAGMAGDLMIVAQAMKDIDNKVPDNIGNMQKKMANMGLAMAEMAGFTAIVGGLVSTGIGALVAGAGLVTIALMAADLMLVAEAMSQLDKKMPSNINGFSKKINGMLGVVKEFVSADFGGVISNLGKTISTSLLLSAVNSFVNIGKSLERLNTLNVDKIDIKSKIRPIKDAIEQLKSESGFWSNLGSFFADMANNLDLGQISSIAEKYIALGKSFEKFGDVQANELIVYSAMRQLRGCIEAVKSEEGFWGNLKEYFSDKAQNMDLTQVSKLADKYIKLGESFEKFSEVKANQIAVTSAMRQIKGCVEEIKNNEGFWSNIGNYFGNKAQNMDLTQVSKLADKYIKLGESFEKFGDVQANELIVYSAMKRIKACVETIKEDSGFWEDLKGTFSKIASNSDISEITNVAQKFSEIGESFMAFNEIQIDSGTITQTMEQIKTSIDSLKQIAQGFEFEAGSTDGINQALDAVKNVNAISQELSNISGEMNFEGIKQNIEQMKEALSSLKGISGDGGEGLGNVATSLQQVVTEFTNLGTGISTQTELVKSSIDSMNQSFSTLGTDVSNAFTTASDSVNSFADTVSSGMSTAVSEAQGGATGIVNAFSGLAGQLQQAGAFAMQGLATGIQSGAGAAIAAATAVANQVASAVRSALDIHSPSRVMMEVGDFVTQGLAKGIVQAKSLVTKASDAISMAAIPTGLDDDYSSVISLDNSEIEKLQASTDQQVVVKNNQVTPQVTVQVTGTGNTEEDAQQIADVVADIIMDVVESALA